MLYSTVCCKWRMFGGEKMKFYKNVDVCDLESIMKNGILSIDKCGNNNWEEGKRANNDTSVVYLFKPLTEINTFPGYGIALLEIECDATENKMTENDLHKDDYIEYVTKEVKPEQIKKIIIPKIFKERISLPSDIIVTWCNIYAEEYGDDGLNEISKERLEMFSKTALINTMEFPFFRGVDERNYIIDLYNVRYIW